MEWIFSSIQTMGVIGDAEAFHNLEYPMLSEIHIADEEVPLPLLSLVQQLCAGGNPETWLLERWKAGTLENMQV